MPQGYRWPTVAAMAFAAALATPDGQAEVAAGRWIAPAPQPIVVAAGPAPESAKAVAPPAAPPPGAPDAACPLRGMDGATHHTIADFSMYVGLPHDVKGTHNRRSYITIRADVPAGDIALRLHVDPQIGRLSVAAENFESIRNHSAYAEITGAGATSID